MNYEKLPKGIQILANVFDECEDIFDRYDNCRLLVNELNALGWTCDYGLDGEPFDLRPLK